MYKKMKILRKALVILQRVKNKMNSSYYSQAALVDTELLSNCKNMQESRQVFLHVIIVCHQRFGELRVCIQSWINQTVADWHLTIIHDGPSHEFEEVMRAYSNELAGKATFYTTKIRYNDYGHTLRAMGLNRPIGKYTMLTNGDNYFIPKTVYFLKEKYESFKNETGNEPDIVLFDMVHSHENPGKNISEAYNFFRVEFSPFKIDMSSAIVKSIVASKVGMRDRSHGADQVYFSDIGNYCKPLHQCKINKILLVHN
jgi:hypothetical protein